MRDKVKRFLSILMTALMLVNLLPVGALAEGMKLDSNSVQSRASKKSANVYVYVKVTGDKAGLTINQSGWYTIGKSENVPGMGTPYWFMHGSHSFSDVGVSYKTVLKTNFTRWTDNQKIDLDQITWTEFYVDNGADDYVKAGTYTWHMNGTIDIKQLPSVYTIKYVDYDTKELIHSYEESGLMGQTPKKITAPDSWQENLYSFYFVNGHPKEQTVDFKKDKGELTFYYKKNTANYTVNYYLNGTTTKVAAPKKGTAALGSSVTESPITVDGYTPVSGDSKKITIKANSDENVINFYYYKNVELTANSDTATYDGNEHSVSGFTGKTVKEEKTVTLSFDSVNVPEVTRKDAGTDTVAFNENPVGKVDTTEKYIVTKATDGQLVISKRPVTLTSASDKKVYDGNALTNDKVTVSGDGFVEGEGATYKVTGTQTNVGKSKNTFTYELNGNTKAINYTITTAEGELEVTAVTDEVVVTIKENAGTAKYDGTEKTVTGYTVTNISNKLYAEKDFTFNGKAEVKGTDAGTYDMALKASDFTNRNANFSKVTFVIEDGQLVIEKRKVTLTSASDEKVYDGTALTNGEVTVSGDGFADGEGAAYDVTGSRTDVGESDNTFTYTLNKGTKADNYTIEKTEGKLKVTPVTDEVVVTIEGRTKTVTYNGEEHTAWQYDVVRISDPLYEPAPGEAPNFWNKNAKGARGTDAGTYPMGWVAEDFENTNTNFSNVKFVVTDGKLVINPRPVTLTSADLTKVYDGTPLKNGDAPVTEMSGTEKAFPDGEGLDYTFTGGQTDVGKSANTFTYKPKEGTNPDNYAITTEYGTLEVTPVTDRVTVKIKGKTDSVMYDGKLHFVFGFDAEPSNKLYNPNEDIQFNGTDVDMIAEGTDAGEYEMGLTVERFTNKSKNFTNVRFEVVEDGKLEIKKRSVKLTSASDEKVYDGKPLMNETVAVGGDGFADGEGVTYDFTGSQTDVGESENLFTFEVNEGTKKENYTFEVAIGTLKVNPVTDKVTVTVTEKSDTVTYDGMPHTVSGYASMTADNPLYDVENDVQETPNAAWAANGTDAGEYPLGIVAGDFKNTNKNFTDVEFVVVDGALTITPAPVTLQAPIASKPYDGTPLKAEDYGHSFVEGLDFADDFASISVEGSQTQAGSSVSQIKEVVPKKGKDLKNYKLTFLPGTLTIAKRSVLITSQSATKTYDGSALTRPAVTITGDGFVPGELAKAEATGSITKVGSTPNTIQYTTTGAFNAANYSIALSVGTLTVTEKPKPEPRRTFNLTINYVYQNGKRAAASYNRGGLKNGETFDITSPVIAGYTASETVVSGTVYNRDIKVTVIYTADGVNLDDYGVPLGLGNITMNVGDCFE